MTISDPTPGSAPAPIPVLPDVVEEHFDELDFLMELREGSVVGFDWNLFDLAEHERRMDAHLDGLMVAGPWAQGVARDSLGGDASGASALVLALAPGADDGDWDALVATLSEGDDDAVMGLRRGLRLLASDALGALGPRLQAAELGDDTLAAAAALDVLAFHRLHATASQTLLRSSDPVTAELALGAAGRLGTFGLADLEWSMQHSEEDLRVTALEAAARCRLHGTAELVRSAARRPNDPDPAALRFLGVIGDETDLATLVRAMGDESAAAAAIGGLGALGQVGAIPALLEALECEVRGPAAVQAYSRITGADVMEGGRVLPVNEEQGADFLESEDEALPPDPERARVDWKAREGSLTPTGTYQYGLAVPASWEAQLFEPFPLAVRRDGYLRSRLLSPEVTPDLELEGLALGQLSGAQRPLWHLGASAPARVARGGGPR